MSIAALVIVSASCGSTAVSTSDATVGPPATIELGAGPSQTNRVVVTIPSFADSRSTLVLTGTLPPRPAPLCLADANSKIGDTSTTVQCIQIALSKFGKLKGTLSGTYDTVTFKAMKEFQAAHPPLIADGLPGPLTLAALQIWSGNEVGVTPASTAILPGPWPAPATAPYPNWAVTADGIPYYSGHAACSRLDADTISTEFAKDGALAPTQQWATYVASRETSCRYAAVNLNMATQDDSHCAFQINALAGFFDPNGELGRRGWTPDNIKSSMQACADAASDLWVFCGQGPWTKPYSCAPPWGDLRTQGN
jgi:peptidoglycan hydrolase-like protein with peptidoglycan-binding domain